jgi:hypothetical protein
MRTRLAVRRDEAHPISLNEWLQYLDTRTDIEVPKEPIGLSVTFKGESERRAVVLSNPGFAKCILPRGGEDGRTGIFNLRSGAVIFEYVKGPIDDHAVKELTVIATALNARVLDDDHR